MQELSRPEFFGDDGGPGYFDYRDGEHVAFIYPTQKGKTTLAWQCLRCAMRQRPHLRPLTLMPKALSPATHNWAQALGFREVPEWPPAPRFGPRPAGHVIWPRHRRDLTAAADRAQVAEVMRAAMHANFLKGRCIMFADDMHLLALMGLMPECEEYWTAGGEGGAGLWGANQKPSGTVNGGSVSTYFYSAPLHYFFGKDTDGRNIQRFSEIGGGLDPREIAYKVRNLRLYQIGDKTISEVLYVDARRPAMALIGPLWTSRNARRNMRKTTRRRDSMGRSYLPSITIS